MTTRTVLERGRRKAYRPLAVADRRTAVEAGLGAYERGDWFLAHELLEPAWMGSDDPAERALDSGLIKLAAAGVHAVRGNPDGVRKNLIGARERLASVRSAANTLDPDATAARIDIGGLVAAIDARLEPDAAALLCAAPPPIPRRP